MGLKIEGDESKPGLAATVNHGLPNVGLTDRVKLLRAHLDSQHVPVKAGTEDPESKLIEELLASSYSIQSTLRDPCAVRKSRAEARPGRFVPNTDLKVLSTAPHLLFGESRFDQRLKDAARLRGDKARSMVTQVIDVGADGEMRDAQLSFERLRNPEQLLFAVEAAIFRIGRIGWIVQLTAFNQLMSNSE